MRKPFHQGSGDGLCSAYGLINALSLVFPRQITNETEEKMIGAIARAYPGDAADLIANGCERPEVDVMIAGIQSWTQSRGWHEWEAHSLHPEPNERAAEFMDALQVELEVPYAAALVGFGAPNRGGTRYEPHYTCVSRVTDTFLHLKDSDIYKRVPRKDVGLGKRGVWPIEDCWILSRARA